MPETSNHRALLIPPARMSKRKRYRNNYLLLIDIFGFLAVASTVAYYLFARTTQSADQELLALWANASTEAIGIYASVRLRNSWSGQIRNAVPPGLA
jgi:hypothetical protein